MSLGKPSSPEMAKEMAEPSHSRQRGEGSIFYSASRDRWIFQRDLPRGAYGPRRRQQIVARTREELEQLIPYRQHMDTLREKSRVRDRSQDRMRAFVRRELSTRFIQQALADAKANGWDDTTLARVIVASLRPMRIKCRVYGPCVYCGDIFADTVDHVIPLIRGGRHIRTNVVSACHPCNSQKAGRTPEEWRGEASA
jgi:5-methylcytosine-specific restriction endonuclease McrA